MNADDVSKLDWQKVSGLLPAVVQHARTGEVLMLGYMDRAALERTLATGRVVFYSRTKERLWEKGETSGNALDVVQVSADCDGDTLLVRAEPRGPVCHLGTPTCFAAAAPPPLPGTAFLSELERVVESRLAERPEGSHTAELAAGGPLRVAQKFGEEALELVLAAAAQPDERVVSEAADALYHLLVVLGVRGVPLARVVAELEARHRAG